MNNVNVTARIFAKILVGVVLLVGLWAAGVQIGFAYGAPTTAAPEKVNAWTIKGGLKKYTFGFPVSVDKLGDCVDASVGGRLSIMCTWPLSVDGQVFRGGVILMGRKVPSEADPVLTNLVLVDSGKTRCDRMRAVALSWRAAHMSVGNGTDIPNDDKHELAWWEGTTAVTFARGPVGENRLDLHQLFRPDVRVEDVECRLAILDMPSFSLSQ